MSELKAAADHLDAKRKTPASFCSDVYARQSNALPLAVQWFSRLVHFQGTVGPASRRSGGKRPARRRSHQQCRGALRLRINRVQQEVAPRRYDQAEPAWAPLPNNQSL